MDMTKKITLSIAVLVMVVQHASHLYALDWPMFRGPDHNGISKETEWNKEWPEEGPKKLWEAQVGIGFTSISTAHGLAYTSGHNDDQDTVIALDGTTGTIKWKHSYKSKLGAKFYQGGPGASPTIDGNRLYTISKWGDLFCLNAKTGNIMWQRQIEEEAALT